MKTRKYYAKLGGYTYRIVGRVLQFRSFKIGQDRIGLAEAKAIRKVKPKVFVVDAEYLDALEKCTIDKMADGDAAAMRNAMERLDVNRQFLSIGIAARPLDKRFQGFEPEPSAMKKLAAAYPTAISEYKREITNFKSARA